MTALAHRVVSLDAMIRRLSEAEAYSRKPSTRAC